jgi:hypothetical protein
MKFISTIHVRYGLMMVAVLIFCLLLLEITGQTIDSISPIFIVYQFIAPAIIWYLGIIAKKKIQKGKLTWKEGVTEGFKISLVFGLLSPLVFALYYLLINPEILAYVKNTYMLQGQTDGFVIVVDMLAQLMSSLVFGTLYAAVISFFVKSK